MDNNSLFVVFDGVVNSESGVAKLTVSNGADLVEDYANVCKVSRADGDLYIATREKKGGERLTCIRSSEFTMFTLDYPPKLQNES